MYDLIIIGAGVSGCCIAREISRYKIKACVIEKGDDVASGTSKANTGVIHTGLEAPPGSLMAELCVRGNELMYEWAKDLNFPAEKNGKLIVCTHEEDMPLLYEQLEHANANGVPECEILDREEVLKREPNLTDRTVAALWAPTGGIVCPFNLAIAAGENAIMNGVEFQFETEASSIEKAKDGYIIHTNKGDMETKAIVNAAGLYADVFHNMVSENKIHITARKGEYLFFDAAGIESPGLTSSPAIGERLAKIISEKMHLEKKETFNPKRAGFVRFNEISDEEREKLIEENPLYGNVICRCELVTEGQIVDAINRPIGARSVDAVKRRVRAGMGRCQGGFCTPKVMSILSRELGIDMTEVTKKGGNSQMVTGHVKE